MGNSRTVLRILLLVGLVVLLVMAARYLRMKKLAADATTAQIEDLVESLDPASRAAVVTKLVTDAGEQVRERLDR